MPGRKIFTKTYDYIEQGYKTSFLTAFYENSLRLVTFSACAVRVIGECDLMQEFLAAGDTDQVSQRLEISDMSRNMTKPVRHNPGCTTTEDG